jgi:hypothetical protein
MAKLKADSLAELVQVVTEARLRRSVPFARVGLSTTSSPSGLDGRGSREVEPVT